MRRTAIFILCAMEAGATSAGGSVEVHYAPTENLERIDRELIASAENRIDMTAYTLTDLAVLGAHRAAQARGVQVRILIDPRQQHARGEFQSLTATMHESTRKPWMHMKSYAIDGAVLRTGSSNFSASGEKQQDNDLVIIRDAGAAARFETHFETIWTAGRPYTGPKIADPSTAVGHPAGCEIKGNVSRKGERIYHLPTDPSYAKVIMNSSAKRWFCSEAQALQAGWRHAGERG